MKRSIASWFLLKRAKQADKLAGEAWTKRMLMLVFKGPAQPWPRSLMRSMGVCLYLEVGPLGCDTHQTVGLDIVLRPKTTPD